MSNSQIWEQRYGGIIASMKILQSTKEEEQKELCEKMLLKSETMFTDEEFRVRNLIGELLQLLIKIEGISVYDRIKPLLFADIKATFERNPMGSDASGALVEEEKTDKLKPDG